jgi:carbon storage regulator CsrA
MLVLTRKILDRIVLKTKDGPVTIYIASIRDRSVRIGIEAPQSVTIKRGELLDGKRNKRVHKS